MHEFPRQTLCELFNQHGTILCEDAERCEFFLKNACGGEYKREVFVLINAIKEDVPKELLNPPQGLPLEVVFNLLAQRLHENLWLDQTAAQWAVESWGIALGLQVTAIRIFEEDTLPRWRVQPITLKPKPQEAIQSTHTHKALKQLSAFNPIDYFRLLWWILVIPQRLQTYRQTFGDGDEMRVGNWLVSTLTWWPLLIPTLALGLEQWPNSNQAWISEGYLLLSALLGISWLLTGILRIKRDITVVFIVFVSGIVAGITAGIVAVGMEVLVSIGVLIGMSIGVAVIIAGIIAVVVADDVATVVAGVVAVGVAVGTAVGITIGITDLVTSFMAGGVAGFMAGFMVDFVADFAGNTIEKNLNTGTPSFLIRFAFLLLVITLCFLIGISFLGGHYLVII